MKQPLMTCIDDPVIHRDPGYNRGLPLIADADQVNLSGNILCPPWKRQYKGMHTTELLGRLFSYTAVGQVEQGVSFKAEILQLLAHAMLLYTHCGMLCR